jgi:Flp pilus assembly pilin Flp
MVRLGPAWARKFTKQEPGISGLTYGLMVGLIGVVALGAISGLGDSIGDMFCDAGTAASDAVGGEGDCIGGTGETSSGGDEEPAPPENQAPLAGAVGLTPDIEEGASEDYAFSAILANSSDPDGGTLTVTAVADAVGGTAEIIGGAVRFTASVGVTSGSFTFTVSDGQGGTADATATLTVYHVNVPPSAGNVALSETAVQGQSVNIPFASILANSSDSDGGTLTVSAVSGATGGTASISGGNVVFTAGATASSGGFTFTVSDGQGGTAAAAATLAVSAKTFYVLATGSGSTVFNGAAPASDGWVVSANSGYGQGEGDGLLVKLDNAGNRVWSTSIGGTRNDALERVYAVPGGGYIAAGNSNKAASGTDLEGMIVRLNASGGVTWARRIGSTTTNSLDYFTDVAPAADGGFVAVGAVGAANGFIVKVNSTGTSVEWARQVTGSSSVYLYGVTALTNGNFLAAGLYNVGSNWGGMIIEIDTNGTVIAKKLLLIGGTNAYIRDVKAASDGGYFIADRYYAGSTQRMFVAKMDSSHNVVWARGLDTTRQFWAVVPTADGGVVAIGDIYVAKFDTAGNTVWLKQIVATLYGGAVNADGDLLILGFFASGTNKGLAVRLKSDGSVTGTCSQVTSQSVTNVNLVSPSNQTSVANSTASVASHSVNNSSSGLVGSSQSGPSIAFSCSG